MARLPRYDVVVVGGGPAGLTAATYTTRLGHPTAVVDRQDGRHSVVAHVHNLVGVSTTVSGDQLADAAIDQLHGYGADYYADAVESIERVSDADETGDGPQFRVTIRDATLVARRVVLATGFTDRPPRVPGLRRFTGRGLHYCLHCDAYTLGDGRVYVLGHDDEAAEVAMLMLNFTDDVDLLLNGTAPAWDREVRAQVDAHPVEVVETPVEEAVSDDDAAEPWLAGLRFADGTFREYAGGFAMYGRSYNNDLARALDCDLHDDGAVVVDGRRRTSVDGVYAAGDVTHGQNQTSIAMGDGAYAGIAVHRDLRTFPVSAAALPDDADDFPDAPAMRADLRARMRRVHDAGVDAGARFPED